MTKFATIAATTLLALSLGTAGAMAADFFDNSDANKDGVVSMSEAMGTYNTLSIHLFNQADENGNGVLDESEFNSLRGLSAGF